MLKKDILRICVQNLLRRKSRTLLTVFGVLIGCCAILIMASLGFGMKESQEKMLSEMGDLTIVTVTAPSGGKGKVKLDDAAVKQIGRIAGISAVMPKIELGDYSLKLTAGVGGRYVADWTTVVGIDASRMEAMGYRLESGTWMAKPGEVLVGRYLAYGFADTLRPEGSNRVDRWSGGFSETGEPLNVPDPFFDPMKTPLVLEVDDGTKKHTFELTPTGVTEEDSNKGYETSEGLMMSLSDIKALIGEMKGDGGKSIAYGSILVKVAKLEQVSDVEKEIAGLGYTTQSMESIRQSLEKDARQKQLMLGGIGAISLLVAALGITNTMIMSISERTREIGIMKSMGCYIHDIRVIFLGEAGLIGLAGGLIGCLFSFAASIVINLVAAGGFSWQGVADAVLGGGDVARLSVIPPWLMLFAVAFSIAIGLGSGFYPANRAVRISALEAIRT